jgi:hypothetical protein
MVILSDISSDASKFNTLPLLSVKAINKKRYFYIDKYLLSKKVVLPDFVSPKTTTLKR